MRHVDKAVYFEKVCSTERRFSNELFVYQSAFPFKPKLIEIRKPRTLVLERVEGIPYLDAPELTDTMIIKLAQAVAALHAITHVEEKVLCHWDNQPKNILWNERKQRIILLDFEDIRLARPEADITHLFLFWADAMDKERLTQCVELFMDNYRKRFSLNHLNWKNAARNSIRRFDRRRLIYGKNPQFNYNRESNRAILFGK